MARLINLKNFAFTVLELIIVIMIVGVLAALAIPRLTTMVETSRLTEAINNIGVIYRSIDRCLNMTSFDYDTCKVGIDPWPLDVDNPTLSPGAHFIYTYGGWANSAYDYQIAVMAARNSYEAPDSDWSSSSVMNVWDETGIITKQGFGYYAGYK